MIRIFYLGLQRPGKLAALALGTALFGAGCSDDDSGSARGTIDTEAERFVLGSVIIDAEGNRVSYAELVTELSGRFTNAQAIEANGNAVFMTSGSDFFYGLAESPEWVRYSTLNGRFEETGRLSFQQFGVSYVDFANAVVDDDTAVSVLTEAYVAIVWNTKSLEIEGTVDLSQLARDGYLLETYTTVAHDGLVYIPGKWVNWDKPEVVQRVSVTILDPKALAIVATAEDDRCGAGGRVTFDERGYAYVMGDGRNQSMQEFARATGQSPVPNCLLRIAPGGTDFEADFFHEIPSLTGGLDSMTEMEAAVIDSGVAFSHMKYEDRLPEGLDRVNFEHWGVPAYKMWRITLGDTPRAEEVQGANYTVVGFSGSAVNGKLYSGESADGAESSVYEVDPVTNTSTLKFTMLGYFAGLHALSR